ncbi:hypothetical protein MRX96_053682 [Rhipicephalus microplus]
MLNFCPCTSSFIPPPSVKTFARTSYTTSASSDFRRGKESWRKKAKFKYSENMRRGRSLFSPELLNNAQKCLDSGDYNMAKAKGQKTAPRVTPCRSLEPHGTDHPHSGVPAGT